MNRLFNGLLVLAALLISHPAFADEVPQAQMSVESVSIPVVQPLPAPEARVVQGVVCPPKPAATDPWPTYTVSLVGGCYTTSEQQRSFALSKGLPLASNEAEYRALIANGTFVRLESGPYLQVLAGRPYVRAETAQFVQQMAQSYSGAGCGRMIVIGAGRLTTEIYENSSPFTVHPFGMAVDIRTNARFGISTTCADWLRAYAKEKEAELLADGTHELDPEHLHLVVVPRVNNSPVLLAEVR